MPFRLLNVAGRAALRRGGVYWDLESVSGGRLPADPMSAIGRWRELAAVDLDSAAPEATVDEAIGAGRLGPPVPRPGKAFGIGLNYRDHAAESGMELPEVPVVFAKYPSCIAGPYDDVPLRGDAVDYEVELVVVIGDECKDLSEESAWGVVAGVTCGQDVSDRRLQFAAKPPQFGLAKSFDGYGPIGPVLVSVDGLADPDALALRCAINGEERQGSTTAELIRPVPELIAYLSRVTRLLPGDLIFTGTPSGVGSASKRYLKPGDVIESEIDGVGLMRNRCVDGA
ncbi:MAG: FAA hydrolase family protein [Acidobacteria bacterium]|nr:MAG: FAA hydrolase family protein [Acidobacteriota bacterium]